MTAKIIHLPVVVERPAPELAAASAATVVAHTLALSVVRAAMAHPTEDMRRAAAAAIGLYGWCLAQREAEEIVAEEVARVRR